MNVSREVNNRLKSLVELIRKWNNSINLVSYDSLDEIYGRHINDSIQLLKYLDMNDQVVDIGSGAGFPGIVLAISGHKNVILVESDSRKCSFLRRAKRLAYTNVEILNTRVEEIENISGDVITARGFARLSKIFEYTQSLKIEKYLLLKGKNVYKEIEEAERDWLFQCRLHDSITDNEGKIVEIFGISRK